MTDSQDNAYEVEEILKPLFLRAQAVDEFEFCCAILRIRGIEEAGWDPLIESGNLLQQVLSLVHAPIEEKLRIRLLLFLYCHATEMDDLYDVIGNLLRVCQGERCSMAPFVGVLHLSGKDAKTPSAKITRINEWGMHVGFPKIGETLQYMLVKQVRNAFFHSAYTIHKDQFRIKRGEWVTINNISSPSVPLEWLAPRLELGINFAIVTIALIRDFIASHSKRLHFHRTISWLQSRGDKQV